jgi:hypothetical protein
VEESVENSVGLGVCRIQHLFPLLKGGKARAKGQQSGYFDCQKAAVVKWTPQDSQSPSAHILHRVLLFAFVSVPHFGHFAKNWVMRMSLLLPLFKGFLIEN